MQWVQYSILTRSFSLFLNETVLLSLQVDDKVFLDPLGLTERECRLKYNDFFFYFCFKTNLSGKTDLKIRRSDKNFLDARTVKWFVFDLLISILLVNL